MIKSLSSIILVFYFFPSALFSQQKLTGSVMDTTEKKAIENAVVLVLHQKDSTLVSFDRTAQNGRFEFNSLKHGEYLLLISAENYADFSQYFRVADNVEMDLGKIAMSTLEHLLQEVVVRQSLSKIRIKGDTTEYRADSFHVGPNATVEDLLKELPGITVDSKGNITANGKQINEVLVDGEPFFSDDPVLVTRNLRSGMVDKVQVYEKKSDLEAFTGIKSRNPKTVVNLKLKEDKKKGFFGNMSIAGGSAGYHNSQAMINKFNGKERMSAFGIVTNTGGYGLSGEDISHFSDYSIFSEIHEINDPLDTWGGNYEGRGFPLLQTGGFHYNNKWNGDTQSVNTNYKISNLGIQGKNNTDVNQILAGKTFENHQEQSYRNKVLSNRVTGSYQFKMDSSSTFKLSSEVNISRKHIANSFSSQSLQNGNAIVNDQKRNTSFQNDKNIVSGTLIWLKKLRKIRRTFSASVFGLKSSIYSMGYIYALNNFYNGNTPSQVQTELVDQFKTNKSKESDITGTLSYTEPVSPKATISLVYGLSVYNGTSNIGSFNKAADSSYSQIDNATSIEYSLNSVRQKVNLQYTLVNKTYYISLGDEFNSNSFDQRDDKNTFFAKRQFIYHNPIAQISYIPNGQTSFGLTYQGFTTQPTLQQLQPLVLNLDPTNKFIGNPDLNPSYAHSVTASYLKFKPIANQTLQATIKFTKMVGAIGLNSFVDSFARTVSQWINIKGNYNGSLEFLYVKPLPKWKITTSMSSRIFIDRYGIITNGLWNYITTETYTAGLTIRKSVAKKYNVSVGGNLRYTNLNASILEKFSNAALTAAGNFNFDFFSGRKITFHTDGNILTRQNLPGFSSLPTAFMMNVWISKKMLTSESLVLKASVNNLLNTNTLNDRYTAAGFTSQTRYDIIERYFLLSLAWNFASKSIK